MSDKKIGERLKFLHCSDLHLDTPYIGLSPDKSDERRAALRQTFRRLFRGNTAESGGLVHPARHLGLVKPHVRGAEADVAADGFLEKLVLRILEHQSHLEAEFADLLGIFPDILSADEHFAGGGLRQAVQ